MPEVDDADFSVRVKEEVLPVDVGVVDATTLLERGQELLQNRERWLVSSMSFPRAMSDRHRASVSILASPT